MTHEVVKCWKESHTGPYVCRFRRFRSRSLRKSFVMYYECFYFSMISSLFFTKESYQDTDQLLRECKNEWTTVTHDLNKPFETGLTTFIRLSKANFCVRFLWSENICFKKEIGNGVTLIMMATVNFSVAYKWSAFLSYQIPSVCLYLTRWWWAARKERLDYWWNNRYRTCQNEKKSCNIMVGLKIASKKKTGLCFFFKTASFEWKTKHFFLQQYPVQRH